MTSGIYSAMSGAVGQERQLAIVANNMANVTTTGYKADMVSFHEALTRQDENWDPNGNAPRPVTSYKYVSIGSVQPDMVAGAMENTGRDLDLSVFGDVFFTVRTVNGDRYTRSGSFMRGIDGEVQSHGGEKLLIEGGEDLPEGKVLKIPLNAREISVSPDGVVRADNAEVGRLRLRRFNSGEDLQKLGTVQFLPKEGVEPQIPEQVQVSQGLLERSNMGVIQGMNEIIMVNRGFESLQKLIRAFRSLDERTARGLT